MSDNPMGSREEEDRAAFHFEVASTIQRYGKTTNAQDTLSSLGNACEILTSFKSFLQVHCEDSESQYMEIGSEHYFPKVSIKYEEAKNLIAALDYMISHNKGEINDCTNATARVANAKGGRRSPYEKNKSPFLNDYHAGRDNYAYRKHIINDLYVHYNMVSKEVLEGWAKEDDKQSGHTWKTGRPQKKG